MFAQERSTQSFEFITSTAVPIVFDRSVSIVGGGFSGTATVIQLVNHYLERAVCLNRAALPSVSINWFDRDGAFGRGTPYREQNIAGDNEVFILNQPARQMSVFAEKPDDYVGWLSSSAYGYGANAFTPRAIYGRYLESRLEQALRLIEERSLPIRINKITADISGAYVERGATASYLVSARGHELQPQISKLLLEPGYVSNPYTVESYRRALKHDPLAASAILVGGGATSIDAVRALEHVGFKGHYHLVASSPGLPWRYEPQIYTPESFGRFVPSFIKLENIPADPSYRILGKLLWREIREARSKGFGEGHVYFAIDLNSLERNRPGRGTDSFIKKITFLRGAIAVPESAELISKLYYEKRLSFVRGRALLESSVHTGLSFLVPVEDRKGLRYEVGEILVNCSPLSHATRTEPVIPANVLSFSIGAERKLTSRSGRTFGVESFRDEIRDSASKIIKDIFKR